MSGADNTLLLVDDDETFCRVLSRALQRRGLNVVVAHDADSALQTPLRDYTYAIVDLNMPNRSGLTLIPQLIKANPDLAIVVLTGYASIQTAVEAIKLGARHYLTKPADADEIFTALHEESGNSDIPVTRQPMPYKRLEWEHLQKVLGECNGNISEAARRLGMHRRTLQRKLQKRPSQAD